MPATPILDPEVIDELMDEWGTEVGKRLRDRRRDLKLSLESVAELTGLSRQTIHRAEYDGRTVRDATRHLIATALAVEVADVWAPMSTQQLRRRARAVA